MVNKCLLILIVALITPRAFAQIGRELNFILRNNPIAESKTKTQPTFNFKESSETKLIFMGTIRLYQILISSQHNSERICNFVPSCSRFGMTAIKKYGPFYGTLMAADRIQRCNGYGKKFYPIMTKSGRRYDPVELYYRKIGCK